MAPEQYDIMALAEDRHWWYMGLRDAIGICLQQPSMRLPRNPVVLDVGCGTGGNLRYLQSLLKPSYLAGFDFSELAIPHARRKCPEADIYQGDIRHPELHRNAFDLILSTDVLYMTGIRETLLGLKILASALRPGGIFMMNLPAYNWLCSDHDRVVHTRERYTLNPIRILMRELDLECTRLSYRVCALLPFIIAKRLPSLLFRSATSLRSDLHPPAEWLNRIFLRILQTENSLIARGFQFPWGSSIMVVAKKKPFS
jgi:SAM-dependent methyltransferase